MCQPSCACEDHMPEYLTKNREYLPLICGMQARFYSQHATNFIFTSNFFYCLKRVVTTLCFVISLFIFKFYFNFFSVLLFMVKGNCEGENCFSLGFVNITEKIF